MTGTDDSTARWVQAATLALAAVAGLTAGVSPLAGVAAAMGLVYVVVVLSDLAVGVAVFTGVSFMDVLPLGGAAGSFSRFAGLLLLISWVAVITNKPAADADFLKRHPAASYILFAFVGWVALSQLWAEDSGATLTALQRYGLNVVLFIIVFTALRTPKHVRWVAVALILGAVGSGLYGMFNPAPVAFGDIDRLGGAGLDANELAAIMVVGLILAGAFALGRRNSALARVLAMGAAAFCAAGVFQTLSRGGIVSLAVALVAACIVGGRWRKPAAALLVLVSLGGVLYFTSVASPVAVDRVTEANNGGGRGDVWTIAWRMVQEHPMRGVGAGNFPVSSIHFLLEPGAIKRDEFIVDTPLIAHNTYLGIGAELGIVGVTLFLALVGFSLRAMFLAARAFERAGDVNMELLSRALLVALIGYLAAIFFISEEFSKQLWLLLAIGPALLGIAHREATRQPDMDRRGGEPGYRVAYSR